MVRGKIARKFNISPKYPEPPEGWEARKPPEAGEVELISERIGGQEREIIVIVESIAYPIIRDECKDFGITPPRIEWVTSLKVRGREHRGGYRHGTEVIYQNSYTITSMLEEGQAERDIIARSIRSILHELSHYVDAVFHKASLGDVVKNYKYYETRADEYAESLMPPKIMA